MREIAFRILDTGRRHSYKEIRLVRGKSREIEYCFYRFPLFSLYNVDKSIFQISFTEVRQTEICDLYGLRGEWRLNYWRFQRKYLCMGTRYVLSIIVFI